MPRLEELAKARREAAAPKPGWNVRFVGGLASCGALAMSFVLLLWAGPEDAGAAAAVAAPESDAPLDLPPPTPPREEPANETPDELVELPDVDGA